MITSAQNAKLKLTRLLLGKPKERRAAEAFVAEGVRLLEEALAARWPARFVLYTEGLSPRGAEIVSGFRDLGVDVEEVSPDLLQAISETETSQGLLAVMEERPLPLPERLDFALIPDQVRDPGNLGTLIRSAAASGVQAVLLPPHTSDAFAPKVVRSAMGAHFRLPLLQMTWAQIAQTTSAAGLRLHLADMEGLSCWQADLRPPLALIIGGEAAGASPEALALDPQRLSIPMPGGAESLNAGVAGSILMFEVVRQRLGPVT